MIGRFLARPGRDLVRILEINLAKGLLLVESVDQTLFEIPSWEISGAHPASDWRLLPPSTTWDDILT